MRGEQNAGLCFERAGEECDPESAPSLSLCCLLGAGETFSPCSAEMLLFVSGQPMLLLPRTSVYPVAVLAKWCLSPNGTPALTQLSVGGGGMPGAVPALGSCSAPEFKSLDMFRVSVFKKSGRERTFSLSFALLLRDRTGRSIDGGWPVGRWKGHLACGPSRDSYGHQVHTAPIILEGQDHSKRHQGPCGGKRRGETKGQVTHGNSGFGFLIWKRQIRQRQPQGCSTPKRC